MLVVRTYVAPSKISGMGVFASEPLKADTLIWRFDPVIDCEITKDQLAALPEAVRDIALSRSFVNDGKLILSRDNGVFLNHSDNPNISGNTEGGSFALRDIAKDEELTEDYRLLPPGACRDFLDLPSS